MYLYTAHLIVTWRFTIFLLGEIGRPCLPLSVHIWSHPPTQPIHEMIDETSDRATLFDKCVPLKVQETGPTVDSPYPRGQHILSPVWGSNPRPPAQQTGTLSTELTRQQSPGRGKLNSGTAKTKSVPTSFVLKVPLCNLRPRIINSVPCDRILQRAYKTPSFKRKQMESVIKHWLP